MSVAAQSISPPVERGHAAPEWWPRAAARASGIAALALVGILTHLALRWGSDASPPTTALPLHVVLVGGGVPLVASLALKLVRREFGSDLLAGISIVAALLLQEYLAGALVVLMLSGGEALEAFALRRASSVLQALARRMPLVAHRRINRQVAEIQLADVHVGDELIVYPHELCPVDGVIIEGHGRAVSPRAPNATHRPAKCSRRNGAERRRDVHRLWRVAAPGRRRRVPRGD